MNRCGLWIAFVPLSLSTFRLEADPLRSWNDGAAKKAISDFVAKVTKEGSADFVPPPERIAVFDNDGTLWAEQPCFPTGLCARSREGARVANTPNGRTRNLSPHCSRATSRVRSRAGRKRLSRSSWPPMRV